MDLTRILGQAKQQAPSPLIPYKYHSLQGKGTRPRSPVRLRVAIHLHTSSAQVTFLRTSVSENEMDCSLQHT